MTDRPGVDGGEAPPVDPWWIRLIAFVALFIATSFALLWLTDLLVGLEGRGVFAALPASLAAAGIATAVVLSRDGIGRGAIGWEPGAGAASRALARGTLVGVALLGAVVLVMVVAGWVRWSVEPGSPVPTLAGVLVALLLAAWFEELLFRGYPFTVLAERFGGAVAVGLTSVAFGAAHALNPNAAALPMINITLAGVLLGLARWRTGSLWFATGLHFGWNAVMASTELAVSGLGFDVPGFSAVTRGPAWVTGGEFGPEGGLLVTAIVLLAIARFAAAKVRDPLTPGDLAG